MRRVQKTGRIDVTVDASAEDVWCVVADVTRVGEWSHECHSARWLGGAAAAAPGARFRGSNRSGRWHWSRTVEIVGVDAPRELVWRTVPTWLFPDSTEWRIELASTAAGTVITQSFRVLRAPWLLDRLYARLLPAHQSRDAKLTEDLVRLGEVARSEAGP